MRAAPKDPSRNMGPDVLWGGRLRASVDDVVGRLRSDSDAIALHIERLADECDRRAVQTDAYAQQWAAYDQAHTNYVGQVNAYNADTTGAAAKPTAPATPARPPAWAEF